ncbi:DDE Tnp4 domain-containing protein, partial [Aphis craccivora]
MVLADKGFLISEIMLFETSLNISPFLMSPQFTPSKVLKTKSIARARIYVERVMIRHQLHINLINNKNSYILLSTRLFIWQTKILPCTTKIMLY